MGSQFEIGFLEWFNQERNYGVIKTPDNNELFFHINNWKDSIAFDPNNKLPILFNVGFHRNRYTATNCHFFNINNAQHWEKIIELKKTTYIVELNETRINVIKRILPDKDTYFDFQTVKNVFQRIINEIPVSRIAQKDEFIYRVYYYSSNENFKKYLRDLIIYKINSLPDDLIIEFWQSQLIPEFQPSLYTLRKNLQKIDYNDIARIQSIETRNLIIISKKDYLIEHYTHESFLQFDKIYQLIESDQLKNKISNDLSNLGIDNYLDIMLSKLNTILLNNPTTYDNIAYLLNNLPSFLNDKFQIHLMAYLQANVSKIGKAKTIVQCWEKNYIELSVNSIIQNAPKWDTEELVLFLNSKKCNEDLSKPALDTLLSRGEYEIALMLAKRISNSIFKYYDRNVHSKLRSEEYFALWKKQIGRITPNSFLVNYLDHIPEKYSRLQEWILTGTITENDAHNLIIHNIQRIGHTVNRYDFYRIYHSVAFLIKSAPDLINQIRKSNNSFISILLWHFQVTDDLNFQTLKGKFIYFSPQDQVNIFKRLFFLKHTGQLEFDLNQLDEIVRADLDLHLFNEHFHDDFILDISTHVIIECLKSYSNCGNFIFESDLILQDLKKNSKRKFKIDQYFDKCQGRLTPYWNWNTNGEVSQVFKDDNSFYYKIKLSPNISRDLKDLLIQKILIIPNCTRISQYDVWTVPSEYEQEINNFAKDNGFSIILSNKKHYDNNIHLVHYSRGMQNIDEQGQNLNIPKGITFCEGTKANRIHSQLQVDFWWCVGQECFQNCVTDHLNHANSTDNEIWKSYTLLDFLKILNINVDEQNEQGIIQDGHYYKFLGHINAFNRLLDHLYCEECENLLYPIGTSSFALYRDVRFHCIEENCSMLHKEIYLNHCLYGECKTIIDSRISKRCEHGMYICSNCGTCCSENFFKRRLETLSKVGSRIYPRLIQSVDNRNGHLEKKEYYCYKCGGMMSEIYSKKFECKPCKVTYDLSKFKWLSRKWTEIHRRRIDYPTSENTTDTQDDEDGLPF